MFMIRLADFEKLGKLRDHEEVLDMHMLVALHTFEQAEAFFGSGKRQTVFMSHQWLGFGCADPNNDHYPAFVVAAQCISQHIGVAKDMLYLWVDVLSIPQACRFTQQLAIETLTMYCTLCAYFCIVANPTKHYHSGELLNYKTYMSRGWCRLEQFTRLVTNGGPKNMFTFDSSSLVDFRFDLQEVTDGLLVQEGTFTCCQRNHPTGEADCDKYKCVDTQLGLYNMLRENARKVDASQNMIDMYNFMQKEKEQVFPRVYFQNLVDKLEELNIISNFENSMSTNVDLSAKQSLEKSVFDSNQSVSII